MRTVLALLCAVATGARVEAAVSVQHGGHHHHGHHHHHEDKRTSLLRASAGVDAGASATAQLDALLAADPAGGSGDSGNQVANAPATSAELQKASGEQLSLMKSLMLANSQLMFSVSKLQEEMGAMRKAMEQHEKDVSQCRAELSELKSATEATTDDLAAASTVETPYF